MGCIECLAQCECIRVLDVLYYLARPVPYYFIEIYIFEMKRKKAYNLRCARAMSCECSSTAQGTEHTTQTTRKLNAYRAEASFSLVFWTIV
jgi:hypothetical protein